SLGSHGVNLEDSAIFTSDINDTRCIHGYAVGPMNSGHSSDDPAGINLTNAIILGVGNVQCSATIYSAVSGLPVKVQRSADGWSNVAGKAGDAIAGDSGDDSLTVDFANPLVAGIYDIEIAHRVHAHARRRIK